MTLESWDILGWVAIFLKNIEGTKGLFMTNFEHFSIVEWWWESGKSWGMGLTILERKFEEGKGKMIQKPRERSNVL